MRADDAGRGRLLGPGPDGAGWRVVAALAHHAPRDSRTTTFGAAAGVRRGNALPSHTHCSLANIFSVRLPWQWLGRAAGRRRFRGDRPVLRKAGYAALVANLVAE
ncbi:hypothetical protein L843_4804 [Mycobacterium intracellulare MIN_061107_1834]|nr:hypothetical protein L843_4804 [Mycobacterium intracellulare MIN_061107_1834]